MEEKFKRGYTRIADLYDTGLSEVDKEHTLKGHIRYIRKGNGPLFVRLYDGTCRTVSDTFQLVFADDKKNDLAISLVIGDTISVTGKIVKSVAKEQPIEMLVDKLEIIGKIEKPETYFAGAKTMPLGAMNVEDHIHERVLFAWTQAIYRIKSSLICAYTEYFHKHGTLHLDPNVITKSDCEGAGELFSLTNIEGFKDGIISKIPRKKISKTITNEDGTTSVIEELSDEIDWGQDFYGHQAFLTVSSQLQLEALCHGMDAVYTDNDSFRAEPSRTSRHVSCFKHLEWEYAHINMDQLMDISEDLVKYCINYVIIHNEMDIKIIETQSKEDGLLEQLKQLISGDFARISYDEAIEIIARDYKELRKRFAKESKEKKKDKKDDKEEAFKIPVYGDDIGSFFEKYLCEEIYKKPLFVHSYPKSLKSFYMKQNDPYEYKKSDGSIEMRQSVQAVDLLVPGLGELIGSSIREPSLEILKKTMLDRKMDIDKYKWYIDLRKDGIQTGGAGLGFDRLVMVCTRCTIHDAIPFPTSYKKCWM